MKEAVWIIGRGLLGSEIESSIRNNSPEAQVFVASGFSWNDPTKIQSEFADAILSFSKIAKQCERYRLFWTAGRGIMSSSEDDMKEETANLARFLTLLQADPDLKTVVGTVSFASSAGGVYAGSQEDTITEATPAIPTTAYGREKLKQEALVQKCTHTHCGVLITRISNLYGRGQSRTKKQGLLTHIARCMLTRTPIHIYVPFDTMRDYVHATDAAEDILSASTLVKAGESVTKIIASEEPTTIAAIIGIFHRITRQNPLLVTGTNELGAAYPHRMRFESRVLTNARRLRRTSLTEGIAATLTYERLAYATHGMPQ